MRITFDPVKNDRNNVNRGLPFRLVELLDCSSAIIKEDVRKDYKEPHYVVQGLIESRLHVVVFTPRNNKIHIISLRKANQREMKDYEQKTKSRIN